MRNETSLAPKARPRPAQLNPAPPSSQTGVIIWHPDDMRRVLNTHQRNFPKDIDLSYKPFMDLLGTGRRLGLLPSFQRRARAAQLTADGARHRPCDERRRLVAQAAQPA